MNENPIMSQPPLYCEVRVNPFRIENVISKSNTNEILGNLQDWVVIQIHHEILLGQISKFVSFSRYTFYGHILRKANENDFNQAEILKKESDEIRIVIEPCLKELDATIKVVWLDKSFNRYKVNCYLIAQRKVNYIAIQKIMKNTLNMRFGVKQIGARDYARSLGGLGVCGREICCRQFLHPVQSITLGMARQQNLYLEPEKLSGVCGKLRCCIGFEIIKKQ